MLKKWFAYFLNKGERFDKKLAPYKKRIFTDLHGQDLLEIGAGAGLNLRYYDRASKVYLIEPNHFAHRYILERSKRYNQKISLLGGRAETIPLTDNSVDVVTATFVFCSVQDVTRVLKEIHRVLKPAGRLLLLEHVAAKNGRVSLLQKLFRPFWSKIADGCDCHRDTYSLIQKSGLFQDNEVEMVQETPSAFLRPWLVGAWNKK